MADHMLEDVQCARHPNLCWLGVLRAEGTRYAKIQATAAIAASTLPEQWVVPHVLAHSVEVS